MCNDLEETAKEEMYSDSTVELGFMKLHVKSSSRSVSTLATNLPVILRFLGSFTMIF